MRIGYSAWGFIGDGLVDSPDGGRLTRALLIEHLLKENYDIMWLQENRDVDYHSMPLFRLSVSKSYKDEQRQTLCKIKYDNGFPQIDVLFLEWRWKIPGRNCDVSIEDAKYTPDYDRQTQLLLHYINMSTKIIIWDKDEKLTFNDEHWLDHHKKHQFQVTILSPAIYPPKIIFERKTLLFPCQLSKIKGTKINKRYEYLIGYVGSQYERDDQIYKYINPFSFQWAQLTKQLQVIFVGNWLKYDDQAKRNLVNFPHIKFEDRILPKDMGTIYSKCLASVLLCKQNYARHCHITQRIYELAMNGVIAIGLKEQIDIDKFINKSLIISDAYDLVQVIDMLRRSSIDFRQQILDEHIERLEPFDINNVMNKFREVLSHA